MESKGQHQLVNTPVVEGRAAKSELEAVNFRRYGAILLSA